MTYHVYVNIRSAARKARIHFSDCSQCNYGEGKQGVAPNNESYWLPRNSAGFSTFAEAIACARRTGMNVSSCEFCNPS
jgi:hypothetical protein